MIGADDIEWIKGAVPYYLLGKHEAMPPPLLPGRDTPADEGWPNSIRFGYMPEKYVKLHHVKYYEELISK
jgi:hypothetical protein